KIRTVRERTIQEVEPEPIVLEHEEGDTLTDRSERVEAQVSFLATSTELEGRVVGVEAPTRIPVELQWQIGSGAETFRGPVDAVLKLLGKHLPHVDAARLAEGLLYQPTRNLPTSRPIPWNEIIRRDLDRARDDADVIAPVQSHVLVCTVLVIRKQGTLSLGSDRGARWWFLGSHDPETLGGSVRGLHGRPRPEVNVADA